MNRWRGQQACGSVGTPSPLTVHFRRSYVRRPNPPSGPAIPFATVHQNARPSTLFGDDPSVMKGTPACSCCVELSRSYFWLLRFLQRRGSRNVEGCWGFPFLKIENFVGFTKFLFHACFDRYEIHIQHFYFCTGIFIIFRCPSSRQLIKTRYPDLVIKWSPPPPSELSGYYRRGPSLPPRACAQGSSQGIVCLRVCCFASAGAQLLD